MFNIKSIAMAIALLSTVNTGIAGELQLSGVITEEKVDSLLLDMIKMHKVEGHVTLFFSSVGGDLNAGYKLGNFLAESDWVSAVIASPDLCVSSCAIAFLAARKKVILHRVGDNISEMFGIHVPSIDGVPDQVGSIYYDNLRNHLSMYLGSVELGRKIALVMYITPPEDMHYIYSPSQLNVLHIELRAVP